MLQKLGVVLTWVWFDCSIGKGLGYKRSELAGLDEGSTLVIGGKEIEVSLCTMGRGALLPPICTLKVAT